MAGLLTHLQELYNTLLERHRNKPFLEASMGACALIAMADGKVSFSQRVHVDQVLETLTELKFFDPQEGAELFSRYVDEINVSPEKGRQHAIDVVMLEAADAEKAQLIVRICLAVSEINGKIPLTEQIEIVALCGRLGVDPGACGLYVDDPAAGLT